MTASSAQLTLVTDGAWRTGTFCQVANTSDDQDQVELLCRFLTQGFDIWPVGAPVGSGAPGRSALNRLARLIKAVQAARGRVQA